MVCLVRMHQPGADKLDRTRGCPASAIAAGQTEKSCPSHQVEALSTILVLNRRSSGAGGSAKFLCAKCGYIFWGSKKAVITHLTRQQHDRGVKIHPCLLAMTPGVRSSMVVCAQARVRACARAHREKGEVFFWKAVTAGADMLPAYACAGARQVARARTLPQPATKA